MLMEASENDEKGEKAEGKRRKKRRGEEEEGRGGRRRQPGKCCTVQMREARACPRRVMARGLTGFVKMKIYLAIAGGSMLMAGIFSFWARRRVVLMQTSGNAQVCCTTA